MRTALVPPYRVSLTMLKIATVLAVIVLIALLCGCNATPNQQYRIRSGEYAIGTRVASGAHLAGKIPDSTWTGKVVPTVTAIGLGLADSYKWLQANPQLADVPGIPLPGVSSLDLLLGVLLGYGNEFPTVPLSPPPTAINPAPAPPTTLPTTQP